MLRAVLFDLGDTLVPEAQLAREALTAVCTPAQERLGLPAGVLAEAVMAVGEARFSTLDGGRFSRYGLDYEAFLWPELRGPIEQELPRFGKVALAMRRCVFLDALTACGLQKARSIALDLESRYAVERRRRHRVHADALPLLGALRDRALLVGVVADGLPSSHRELLRATGAESGFDSLVFAVEERLPKPAPRLLEIACERLGVTPDEALYVGDAPEDAAMAEAAQVAFVCVKRDLRDVAPRPARRIYELSGLLGIVDGLRAGRSFRVFDPRRAPVSIDVPQADGPHFLVRVGPDRDELRPAAKGATAAQALEAALRALKARAQDAPYLHELGEPIEWDALLR